MTNQIQIHGLTDVGKVRAVNEDNWGERKTANGQVVVVCDGMGGHANGSEASKIAVQAILDFCEKKKYSNPMVLLHEAIKFANTQILGYAASNPQSKGMGTTCVVVLITQEGNVFYGHVGDSRLYRFDGRQLVQVTRDHSLVQMLADSGQITLEQMETHPERNKILKALGLDELMTPEICSAALNNQGSELLLLCTDGLSGLVTKDNMLKSIQTYSRNLQQINSRLVEAALQAGGTDNITSVLIALPVTSGNPSASTASNYSPGRSGFSFGSFLAGALLVAAVVAAVYYWNRFGGAETVDPQPQLITEVPEEELLQEPIDSCGLLLDPVDSLMHHNEWRKARTALAGIKNVPCQQAQRFIESKKEIDGNIQKLDSGFLQKGITDIRNLLNQKKLDEADARIQKFKKGTMQPWALDSVRHAEERLAQLRKTQ